MQELTIFLQEVVHFCPQRLQDCSFIFCRRFLLFSPLGSSSPASAGFGWASFATTENSIRFVLKSKKNMELIILQVIYTHYNNYLMSKIFLQLKEGNNFGTET